MAVQTCLKKNSNYVKLELRALELSEIDLYWPSVCVCVCVCVSVRERIPVWCDRGPGRKTMNTYLDGVCEFFDQFGKSIMGLWPHVEETDDQGNYLRCNRTRQRPGPHYLVVLWS